mmetsp:Transcript_127893/g.368401  ORF Transcript_127893/g.368401 Transcript_127893/m.368401 type:complete len:399 (-) Transcript_127893:26-1222(-)
MATPGAHTAVGYRQLREDPQGDAASLRAASRQSSRTEEEEETEEAEKEDDALGEAFRSTGRWTGEDTEVETDPDLFRKAWSRFAHQATPNIFEDIVIAEDGGLSEVEQLWSPMRYLSAALSIGFIVSNVYYIIFVDVKILMEMPPSDDFADAEVSKPMFLVTAPVSNLIFHKRNGSHADDLIAYLELLGITVILAQTLHLLCTAYGAKSERLRWFALDQFFWQSIPELSSYSAMRLLHYVSPTVFRSTLLNLVNDLKTCKRREAVRSIVWFVLFHTFCLVVGFDAFLVKIRSAYASINQEQMRFRDLYAAFLFMMQVLGVIKLSTFVQSRLFLFIFAGEDGVMDPAEKAKQEVWTALLVRKIGQVYPPHKFLAIMLSFGDTDFQKLVLNENVKQIKGR